MSNLLLGNAQEIRLITVTFDAASIAANTTAAQSITVTGVKLGDFVMVQKVTPTAGAGIVGARVTAADTVSVTFSNNTAAPIDPASDSYFMLVIRPDSVQTAFN